MDRRIHTAAHDLTAGHTPTGPWPPRWSLARRFRLPRRLSFSALNGHSEGTAVVSGCVPRDLEEIARVRHSMQQLFHRCQLTPDAEFDLILAVGEAVTNAVRYGTGRNIRWSAEIDSERVCVEIDYCTRPFNSTPRASDPEQMLENGRGLLLMRNLTDDLQFRFRRGEVRVSLVKRLS